MAFRDLLDCNRSPDESCSSEGEELQRAALGGDSTLVLEKNVSLILTDKSLVVFGMSPESL